MLTENPAVFTDPRFLGDVATWSVGPKDVNGIFDAAPTQAFGMLDATGPVFRCAMADVPTIARGQTLTISAVVYTVTRAEKNFGGPGWVRVHLER